MSEIKPSAELWNARIERKHKEQFAEDQRARHEKRMEQLRAGNKWRSDILFRLSQKDSGE